MKDRIQELFDQVMDDPDPLYRFAELVRQDEREQAEKQEPVAWMYKGNFHDFDPSEWASPEFVVTPLFTAPPKREQEPVNTMPTKIVGPNLEQILNAAGFYKREWVGLTELEINHYNNRLSGSGVAEEIQAKLRERNT